MAPSDTENSTFVGNYSPAEFRDTESILKGRLMRLNLIDIKEVYGLAAPLEIVYKLVAGVALLKNESVVKQLVEFIYHIKFLIVRYSAGEFPKFAHFVDQVPLDLIELSSDGVEGIEVPLYLVLLNLVDFHSESVQTFDDLGHLLDNALLPVFTIFDVAKSLLFEEATDK